MNMMNKKSAALPLILLCATPALAGDSFSEKCPDIPSCAKTVSELMGQQYAYDVDIQGKMSATSGLLITRENAELLFTDMLNINGFTRVPLGPLGTYQIMRQRDARDSTLPIIRADKNTKPELPHNWDLYTMIYKSSHSEVVDELARTSRSFMPANSRIIPSELSSTLIVTDSALNIKKLYEILREIDQKPTPEFLRKRAKEEARREAERAAERAEKNSKAHSMYKGDDIPLPGQIKRDSVEPTPAALAKPKSK